MSDIRSIKMYEIFGDEDDLNTPWQRVELVEPDVFVLPEQSVEAAKKARGGPSTRMHRAPVPRR
ncbi:hypothetical protein [Candidatus Macondimonas diazotrophica]|jgi:hypothetical protein|uniref:Uncharacterized protein n=1 Tax=Candidatus Macondimonas diazotrophica TaxID=2305248 RepID=A0A4Z0F7A5_9GAMM|nr:hypothetical protein [Candidatus Macondimonas diazotrophica]TFZ81277.1 hypothetical protein E4680_13145 [Candidatus Macondimonas diazotrophica]